MHLRLQLQSQLGQQLLPPVVVYVQYRDVRCFFRAIAIALNSDLQASEQNPVTGEMLDKVKTFQETAYVDKTVVTCGVMRYARNIPCISMHGMLMLAALKPSLMAY